MELAAARRRVRLPCPVCGSRSTSHRRTLPNLDPNADAELPEISVAACSACGLIRQDPCPSFEVMERIYGRLSDKVSADSSAGVNAAEDRGRLEALLDLRPPPGRLLAAYFARRRRALAAVSGRVKVWLADLGRRPGRAARSCSATTTRPSRARPWTGSRSSPRRGWRRWGSACRGNAWSGSTAAERPGSPGLPWAPSGPA